MGIKLTKSEKIVMNLVCTGISNKDAASKVMVSDRTIKFHLTNIFKKLNVKSRTELIFKQLSVIKQVKEV